METANSSKVIRECYISQGEKSRMYTLWLSTILQNKVTDRYITNLSTDFDVAYKKASEYANKLNITLVDLSSDLNIIVRKGDGKVGFGKNYGKHVSELDDNFLMWLAGGSVITYISKEGYELKKPIANPELIENAIQEATKRNLYVNHNGKTMTKSLRDYLINEELYNGHHLCDKEKATLNLEVVKINTFYGAYGETQLIKLKDIETGKYYYYKGNSFPKKIQLNTICDGDQMVNINKGVILCITFTAKLNNYKNLPQTLIQRPKIDNEKTIKLNNF